MFERSYLIGENMLKTQETLEKFGYSYDTLSENSARPVIISCDYCGTSLEKQKKVRVKSNKILDKDACVACKFKKRAELSMIKYGVSNSAKRPEVKSKISAANKSSEEETQRKFRETCASKFGVENPMHSSSIKEKQKESLRSKYGVDNPSQSEEIREKVKETNLERFGVEEFLSLDTARIAYKEKYGIESHFNHPNFLEKSKQTTIQKFGVDHHLKVPERALENSRKGLQTKIENGQVKLYEGRTISEHREDVDFSDSRFRTLIHEYGFDIAKKMEKYTSSLEKIIQLWLEENKIEYRKRRISSYIPDFIIGNVVLELDGLYWHCDKICEDNHYHFKKREEYVRQNYTPLFFRENEIRDKLPIVKSIILNKLGKSIKVGARKCEILILDRKIGNKFLEDNHLMGPGNGIHYALSYENKIVAVFQVKRIKDNNWELSRFACKLSYNIVGGFSKLFQAFLKDKNPDSFLTFIDMRYGNGNYLPNLGFKEKTCYPSFKWTDTKNTYARTQFPSNSGYEKGLYKIWDCGQKKFVWEKGV